MRQVDGPGQDQIFHLVDRSTWAAAVPTGEYVPAAFAQDGFVHFSFADQLARVANARYRDAADLIVVEVDPSDLDVVVEDSYGSGEEFPHVYSAIPVAAVVGTYPLARDGNGDWTFSPDVPPGASASPDR